MFQGWYKRQRSREKTQQNKNKQRINNIWTNLPKIETGTNPKSFGNIVVRKELHVW